jgi:hypothetical protein
MKETTTDSVALDSSSNLKTAIEEVLPSTSYNKNMPKQVESENNMDVVADEEHEDDGRESHGSADSRSR